MKLSQNNIVLIASQDVDSTSIVTDQLDKIGYTVITAQTNELASTLFLKHQPQLIIYDVTRAVQDGKNYVTFIRERDAYIPILLTADLASSEQIPDLIHQGANDFIFKPLHVDLLIVRIEQLMSMISLENDNMFLSQLGSIHALTNQLSQFRTIDEVIKATLQFCFEHLHADTCMLSLQDPELPQLCARGQKNSPVDIIKSPHPDQYKGHEINIIEWIVNHNQSLATSQESGNDSMPLSVPKTKIGAIIAVPIHNKERIAGILLLERIYERNPFNHIELHLLEKLSVPVAKALHNTDTYTSMRQKIAELQLTSNYSEHFVGLFDISEVIKTLFITLKENFSIEVMGCLIVKKRFHDFLYWTRGSLATEHLVAIIEQCLTQYNEHTGTHITSKRVKSKLISIAQTENKSLSLPLPFTKTFPLFWDESDFGILYFGSKCLGENHQDKLTLLTSLISQTRIALINSKLYSDMKENYIRTIKALAIAVDAKDTYTHGHSENVMNIAESIATEMGMDEKSIGIIRDGGLLHDIGKIGIPGYILNKPGPLTYEEFNGVMKTHSTLGANIVKEVPFLKELYSLILYHHEHHDGTGYPDGLCADSIPLGARILHVADAFEAMTSHRPYRISLDKEQAVNRLIEQKGKECDPDVVDALVRLAIKKGWVSSDSIKDRAIYTEDNEISE